LNIYFNLVKNTVSAYVLQFLNKFFKRKDIHVKPKLYHGLFAISRRMNNY